MTCIVYTYLAIVWIVTVCNSLQTTALSATSSPPDGADVQYFMTLSNPVNCSYSDVSKLISDKQNTYNPMVIPRLNMAKPVTIQIGFNLIAFRDFDEVCERFSVVGSLDILWKDELMTWNTSDYGGLETFMIPKEIFWKPILVLVNAYEEYRMVGEESYWPVRYSSTGMAFYFPGSVFTSTCLADVSNYPWDNHVCTLVFSAYGYSSLEIQLKPLYKKVRMNYFMGHGEWEIVGSKVETTFNDLVVMFRFEFKRKPLFVLVNIIIPIVFTSLLNSLVFLVPVNAGERVSYSITVLLALAVFLTLVSENMPKSGKTIAVLSYYLLSLLSISMFIMLGTVVSLTIHQRSPDVPISQKWKTFAKSVTNRRRSPGNGRISDYSRNDTEQELGSDEESNKKGCSRECRELSPGVTGLCACNKRRVFEPILDGSEDGLTWTELGGLLDMVFFVITISLLLLFTVTYFVYAILITH